jgi:hypothetical protein
MIKVGILVGHHGRGTGATLRDRDEWSLCYADALNLVQQLDSEGLLCPVFIHIDGASHPWDIVQKISKLSPPSFLGGMGNIDARVEWALRDSVQAAVEFHLNRSTLNSLGLTKATGHEVFIRKFPGPKTRKLGELLIEEFNRSLGNKNRGLKRKSFRVLRKLHARNIPAAILEPAFLAEDRCVSKEWRGNYVGAVKTALYRFFNLK